MQGKPKKDKNDKLNLIYSNSIIINYYLYSRIINTN